jgi:valyl-tRNA synthetase
MSELPKTFDPAEIEARWYARWEGEGLFRPERPEAEPWTIVMPPPNVTGSLHIGHALDITLQDILTRHARLQGKDALWVVGTDHAGIATQMVVERQLNERQQKRTDFTREEFIAKVWEWKAESGGAITGQLRRLGASCDWANERFTMDEGFSRAVLKVFVDLYNQKLLYRDKRLVNWDPGLKTAISDLEVETTEVAGSFWHFRYPLEDGSGFISVATTRPETMLADMAVAVNAKDARYTHLVGKQVRLPITGRLVPIITDDHADPELGSGAVKITPGHDFNDFEVGKRVGFKPAEMLNMLDGEAKVAQTADGLIPAELIGMDRFEARKRVVELIDEAGLLEKVEERMIATPYADRSGVVIEPWLTDQWYVDAETLAKPAIEAVRSADIRVVPETWKKTWFNWLENIQPWCVSRQLWWGHRIPAWYGPAKTEAGISLRWTSIGGTSELQDESVFVAENEQEAIAQAAAYYNVPSHQIRVYSTIEEAFEAQLQAIKDETGGIALFQESDVLDTWFSSALWPFATLGWPDDTEPTLSPGGIAATGPSPGRTKDSPQWQGEGVPPSGSTPNPRTPSPQPSPLWGEGAAAEPARWVPKPGTTLARHYPNDVLISGFDIIFFWDARMAMMGFHFMGEKPWKTLYLHGLVRDAQGRKMSKSKGNTIDPLGLIDRYGADAIRFTLASMESQGRDIKLDEKRVEGYRNFATKIWNAARFCQANGIGASSSIEPPAATLPVNRWIVGETVKTVQALDLALAELRYDEAANAIYQFTWATFCDWYLELIKTQIDDETKQVAAWVFDQILVMLHPFMPFVTEELWGAMGERAHPLILAKWPMPDARALDPEAGPEVDWLIRLVGGIRAARAELSVPPGAKLVMYVRDAKARTAARLDRHLPAIRRLARIEAIGDGLPAGGAAQIVVDEAVFILPLEGVIDVEAEKSRLTKAAEAAEKDRDTLAARLANPSFVERARPEAVEKARADHEERASEAEKYRAALARLG